MTSAAILALLLLLAFSGWLLWQRHQEGMEFDEGEDERISPLLRGINYLLADEPDRALQQLVQVARLRTESADVYMALGGMFRAKGELGRAVRIHQNLLARPDLPKSLHLQARLALALDFQTGGLLDRALKQYRLVLDEYPDHQQALQASLRIREQSSEWLEAEELLTRLDRIQGNKSSLHHAYLLAEIAREKQEKGDSDAALESAERALSLDASCAAAHLVKIDVELQRGNVDAAFAAMERLRTSAPRHFPLVVPVLMKDKKLYAGRSAAYLLECWQKERDEAFALAWLEAVESAFGHEQMLACLAEIDLSPSSLRASLRLAALSEKQGDKLSLHARVWRKSVKNYACSECGVATVEMRWQCPQCHTWGSMVPIKDEEH